MLPIRDSVPGRNPPVAVYGLILANALVFLLELGLSPGALEHLFYIFGVVPARYTHPHWADRAGLPPGSYWPFLTHMFLHAGWMHVVGNMWTLWIFGDNVEDRMGPRRFLAFYLLSGLAAAVAQVLLTPRSTAPAVGASGAIAGVMGAYFFLFPRSRIILLVPIFFLPFFFEIPAYFYLGYWALTQFLSGTVTTLIAPSESGGVAWWAHVGGFLAGVILHPFFLRRGRAYRGFSPDEYWAESVWGPVRRRRPRSWE